MIIINNKVVSLSTDSNLYYLQTPKSVIYSKFGGNPKMYPVPDKNTVIFESKDSEDNYIRGDFQFTIPIYGLYEFLVCNSGMCAVGLSSYGNYDSWREYVVPGGLSGTKHSFKVYLNPGTYQIHVPNKTTWRDTGILESKYSRYVNYTLDFPKIDEDYIELYYISRGESTLLYKLEHTLTTRDWIDIRVFDEVSSNETGYTLINNGLANIENCYVFGTTSGNQYYIGRSLVNAANNNGTITTTLDLIDSETSYNEPRDYKLGTHTYYCLQRALSPIDNSTTGPGASGDGIICETNSADYILSRTLAKGGYAKITYLE